MKKIYTFKNYLILFLISSEIFLLSFNFEDNERLLLNPEYKIKRTSSGTVIAYSSHNGRHVSLEFDKIPADVILAALQKRSVRDLIPKLSKKYSFDEDECRREIKHSINVLTEWNILLPENS